MLKKEAQGDCSHSQKNCKRLVIVFLGAGALPRLAVDLLDALELVDVVPLLAAGGAAHFLPDLARFGLKDATGQGLAAAVGAVVAFVLDVLFFAGGLEHVEFMLHEGQFVFGVVLFAVFHRLEEGADLFHPLVFGGHGLVFGLLALFIVVRHGAISLWCMGNCFLTMIIIANKT